MPNLTQDRKSLQGLGDVREPPMKGGVVIFTGGVVEIDSAGLAIPATSGLGKKYVGINDERTYDNSDGADGDRRCRVTRNEWGLDNSTGAEEITLADVGSDAFLFDDHTVQKTDAGGTLTSLGKIFDVRDGQVYVTIL